VHFRREPLSLAEKATLSPKKISLVHNVQFWIDNHMIPPKTHIPAGINTSEYQSSVCRASAPLSCQVRLRECVLHEPLRSSLQLHCNLPCRCGSRTRGCISPGAPAPDVKPLNSELWRGRSCCFAWFPCFRV
jgi:hypothetical protein